MSLGVDTDPKRPTREAEEASDQIKETDHLG